MDAIASSQRAAASGPVVERSASLLATSMRRCTSAIDPLSEASWPRSATSFASTSCRHCSSRLAKENVRRSEYHVHWQERSQLPDLGASFQAPNRSQNLRTHFTPGGIHVVPRTGDAGWRWGLAVRGFGAEGCEQAVSEALPPQPRDNRIEYRRGPLTEWYVNDERGIEQGFDLPYPPDEASS